MCWKISKNLGKDFQLYNCKALDEIVCVQFKNGLLWEDLGPVLLLVMKSTQKFFSTKISIDWPDPHILEVTGMFRLSDVVWVLWKRDK